MVQAVGAGCVEVEPVRAVYPGKSTACKGRAIVLRPMLVPPAALIFPNLLMPRVHTVKNTDPALS